MNENILLAEQRQELISTADSIIPSLQFNALNPLVAAAMPLLLLMVEIKRSSLIEHDSILELRERALSGIVVFYQHATKLHCNTRLIAAARYILCTAIDESVLSSHWGNHSIWSNQTLLSFVHKETWGGERFFLILDEMKKNPSENLFILELFYIILSLGFEGKYYSDDQGIRDGIRNQLFQTISTCREEPSRILSPSTSLLSNKNTPPKNNLKMKILLTSFGFVFLFFTLVNLLSYLTASSLINKLETITASMPEPILTLDLHKIIPDDDNGDKNNVTLSSSTEPSSELDKIYKNRANVRPAKHKIKDQ